MMTRGRSLVQSELFSDPAGSGVRGVTCDACICPTCSWSCFTEGCVEKHKQCPVLECNDPRVWLQSDAALRSGRVADGGELREVAG
jgi:hypothetical protein